MRERNAPSSVIGFNPYTENRQTGGFILIDKMTNETVSAGLAALRRAGRRTSAASRKSRD
jgi:sulfate adenylyltransferase subunit 1 (EFTu-like GTPase family)